MFIQLKNELDKKLKSFMVNLENRYHLKDISPVLHMAMKDFILRGGKRIRPILFIMGYRGFTPKNPRGLFESALSIEILHSFLLIHDDIIDKSLTRRGKPAMHVIFKQYLKKYPKAKFSGEDLAIVAGDIIYALAIESFLAIEENPARKEKALKKFIEAAFYTGCGEFIDTMYGAQNIEQVTLKNINRIYDFKTAHYTFAGPLITGAILAGANDAEIKKLSQFGMNLGRAFQIKDDILGIFAEEKYTGKPVTNDLQENKKTLLLWFAFKKAAPAQKRILKTILSKNKITPQDIAIVQNIMAKTKSLEYAKANIAQLLKKAVIAIKSSKIKKTYKEILTRYSTSLLQV